MNNCSIYTKIITDYSRRNHLTVLSPTSSLRDALSMLIQNHRIAVGDDTLENYITQSDFVKFFRDQGIFDEISQMTVNELNLGNSPVISINRNQRVIEAFKLMIIHNINGIAVVDDDSHFVGQISSTDIRCISTSGDKLNHLYDNYSDYHIIMEKYNPPINPITVNGKSNLMSVIETMLTNKIHRVYVVEDYLLQRVITFTDILRASSKIIQ